MGTRSCTIVKVNGEIKVAQYGQWDGGISRGGAIVWWFCKTYLTTSEGTTKVKEALSRCVFLDRDEIRAIYPKYGFTDANEATEEQWQSFKAGFPLLFRDPGPKVLISLMGVRGSIYLYNDENDYPHQWGNYNVDLDEGTLEVIEGGKVTSWKLLEMPDLSTFVQKSAGCEEYGKEEVEGAWRYLVRLGIVGDTRQAMLCEEDSRLGRKLYPNTTPMDP